MPDTSARGNGQITHSQITIQHAICFQAQQNYPLAQWTYGVNFQGQRYSSHQYIASQDYSEPLRNNGTEFQMQLLSQHFLSEICLQSTLIWWETAGLSTNKKDTIRRNYFEITSENTKQDL